ncbi:unnamed protein product (macronuclear) [Paramecium tetraurelia]|uniref:Uncharacterized protein n=1 Tax=Paramecium tetraurelia TaxID=5888 RepID=A0BE91_PARTE|nr:uncharacterized protein GSPATT00027891001 [Paramecium tetraurelia]CAK56858.1 unnamed protein product [Paramecium tetraurelia]|eukprot:XP_001424256.1 hypothetical protein (macronuclear) [Paramecium tetraurelia strain d4-2]
MNSSIIRKIFNEKELINQLSALIIKNLTINTLMIKLSMVQSLENYLNIPVIMNSQLLYLIEEVLLKDCIFRKLFQIHSISYKFMVKPKPEVSLFGSLKNQNKLFQIYAKGQIGHFTMDTIGDQSDNNKQGFQVIGLDCF